MLNNVNIKLESYFLLSPSEPDQDQTVDNIPEISDLNVPPNFRNKSIGSPLIEKCEQLASTKYDIVGIGVSLHPDLGMVLLTTINT